MNVPHPMYVFASYRDGHIDMTKVPTKYEAYGVLRDRYESDGADVVKMSASPPKASFMKRDSVELREYEPHKLLSELALPRPVKKGSKS